MTTLYLCCSYFLLYMWNHIDNVHNLYLVCIPVILNNILQNYVICLISILLNNIDPGFIERYERTRVINLNIDLNAKININLYNEISACFILIFLRSVLKQMIQEWMDCYMDIRIKEISFCWFVSKNFEDFPTSFQSQSEDVNYINRLATLKL